VQYQTDFTVEPFRSKQERYKQGPRSDFGKSHSYPKKRRIRKDKDRKHNYPAKRKNQEVFIQKG